MCGRFVRHSPPSTYAELFGVDPIPGGPSFNVAPTQNVAAIRVTDGQRMPLLLRWGLIPVWAKDKKTSFVNARADTVFQKPAFRSAIKKRRCLVLADGYYEWKKVGKAKQPYYFHMRDGRPFAFAGIWECWKGEDEPLETCALLTTEPNELARTVHDRMPVILPIGSCDAWLDSRNEDAAALQGLLGPYPAADMACHAVTPLMGNVRHNGPDCIEPIQPGI
jgi:putative SOS response-associated peptidase YedK